MIRVFIRIDIHNQVAEGFELDPLEGLRKVVGQHYPGGAILNFDFPVCDSIVDKEVPDVNVPSPLAA